MVRLSEQTKSNFDTLSSNSGSEPAYKIYTALLTQTGTDAPVATVLENTLGELPTYSYAFTGGYHIVVPSLFAQNLTFVQLGHGTDITNNVMGTVRGDGTIRIKTGISEGSADDVLFNTAIEIKVYE